MHVTKQTLEMLDGKYMYGAGTEKARQDPFLQSNDIETFLISPQYFQENHVSNRFLIDERSLEFY